MFPGLQTLPEGQILAFGLVFLRTLSFFIALPIFGVAHVPSPAKILFSLMLAVLLFPTLSFTGPENIRFEEQILFFGIKEILVGLFLGYFLRVLMMSFIVAGDMIGMSAGLASAQMFNPLSGGSSNVIEQFYLALATLIFLALNGHHIFLLGFAKSLELIPVTSLSLNAVAFNQVTEVCAEVFMMGIKMAAPVIVSVFLANVVLGVLGRAVPQINIFVLSLQVTLIVSFAVMIVGFPMLAQEVESLLAYMGDHLMKVMKTI